MRVLELPSEVRLEEGASLSDQLRCFLVAQLNELEAHDPGVRLGEDPEDVHRFRVATRRTRALIRATRPLYGRALRPLAAELHWLAGLLGPVRDLDVLLAHLQDEVAALDDDMPDGAEILRVLDEQRERVPRTLLEALSSPRYCGAARSFERSDRAAPAARRRQRRGDDRRKRAAQAAQGGTGAPRRSRPTTSCTPCGSRRSVRATRPSLRRSAATKSAQRVVDAAKKLQDMIGEHQDAVVAEERLRSSPAGPARSPLDG